MERGREGGKGGEGGGEIVLEGGGWWQEGRRKKTGEIEVRAGKEREGGRVNYLGRDKKQLLYSSLSPSLFLFVPIALLFLCLAWRNL